MIRMKLFTFGLFLYIQFQNCLNDGNNYTPIYEIDFKENDFTTGMVSLKKPVTSNQYLNYSIVVNKNTVLPLKFAIPQRSKKSKIEITTQNVESFEHDVEEIESYTTSNDGENGNTTIGSSTLTTDNVTDFAELTTEDITEFMNTTVTTFSNTTLETTTQVPKTKKFKYKGRSSSKWKSVICECDLSKSICDINCCCDKDCLDSDKSVFTECVDYDKLRGEYWNSKYCSYKQIIFKNNSPWLIENNSNDLFCILKNNLPPKLKGKGPKVITSNAELNFIAKQFYSWPNEKLTQYFSFDNSKPYIYKDNIWILVNTTLQILDVPTSNFNNYCSGRTNIRYLVNFKSTCLSELPNMEIHDVFNQTSDLFLISSPTAFNETWIKNPKDCPASVCIPISKYLCNTHNCTFLNSTEDRPVPSCIDNYCINMITSVKYDFYTNGSTGFTNASLYFVLSDIFLVSKYIKRDFEVTQSFVNRNISEISRPLSGNPGYRYGKPIIISKMIRFKENNDSEEVETLEYFSLNTLHPLRDVFAFPKNINGFCVLTNLSFEEIRFHENVQSTCKSVQNLSDFILKENATAACLSSQQQFITFFPYNIIEGGQKLYVSAIGNPSTDLKNWVEVLHDFSPNPITGTFGENTKTLSCLNVVSKLIYTFVYASVPQPNIQSQMNIVGVGIKYIANSNTLFKISNNLATGTISVSTRFIDVTKREALKFARGPNFRINLPADFFYPFSFSHSTPLQIDRIYIVLCILIVIKYFWMPKYS